MSDATFDRPNLTTFCRLEELGLEVPGQRTEPFPAVLGCRVVTPGLRSVDEPLPRRSR